MTDVPTPKKDADFSGFLICKINIYLFFQVSR